MHVLIITRDVCVMGCTFVYLCQDGACTYGLLGVIGLERFGNPKSNSINSYVNTMYCKEIHNWLYFRYNALHEKMAVGVSAHQGTLLPPQRGTRGTDSGRGI